MVASLAVLLALQPRMTWAQMDFPVDARAAVYIRPARVVEQNTVDRAFGLHALLDLYLAPERLGTRAERFTLYTVRTTHGFAPIGVTRGSSRIARDFEQLRGARTGSVGGHALYTYRHGGAGRLVLVGRRDIVEGNEEVLRRAFQDPGRDAASQARRDLERSLLRVEDTGAAATLVYVAPAEGSNLVEVVRDLGAIWGPQLARSVEPYEAVLGLMGTMRGGRADVWQDDQDLGVRIVLVASDDGAAKRSHLALRTARSLAPMASKAAVRAGSMSQDDADVLADVLRGLESRVEDDRIYVTLYVPGSIVP